MTFMFLALAQLTNKAFTDAGKGRIRQSLTALVQGHLSNCNVMHDKKNLPFSPELSVSGL